MVSLLERVHYNPKGGLPGLFAAAGGAKEPDRLIQRRPRPHGAGGAAVTALTCVGGGVLSAGADGAVRYLPLLQQPQIRA